MSSDQRPVVQPPTRLLRLPDGRRLAWVEYGRPEGTPMLFFHGHPGSRLTAALLHDSALAAGVRLLSADRPGIGESDPLPGLTHSGWVGDVRALLDHLELPRVRLVGWSAGGPFALACAVGMPARVAAVGVLAGVGQNGVLTGAWESWRARWGPEKGDDVPTKVADTLGRARDRAGDNLQTIGRAYPRLLRSFAEDARQLGRTSGSDAVLRETRMLSGAWDFDPRELRVPVRLWHGEHDALVPTEQSRQLARMVPGAQLTCLPATNHVSVLTDHGEEILRTLARLG